MLQLNTIWKLPKITLIKSCEQMWVKTFYFATLIFVKLLKDKGDLYEFSGIYENVLVPLFKSLKPAGDLFAIISNVARGFSRFLFFSPSLCWLWHWRHAQLPAELPCRRGPSPLWWSKTPATTSTTTPAHFFPLTCPVFSGSRAT